MKMLMHNTEITWKMVIFLKFLNLNFYKFLKLNFSGLVFNDEISKDINELEPCFLFGVFDGHGGADCMKYLKKNLVKV